MNEMPASPEAPKKKNNILMWIGAALLLCCCCSVGAYVMYQYLGDPIMQALGL